MAPGVGPRRAAGLLVLAALLPLPAGAVAAAAPLEHTSALFRTAQTAAAVSPAIPPDPDRAGSKAGEGRGHPGRKDPGEADTRGDIGVQVPVPQTPAGPSAAVTPGPDRITITPSPDLTPVSPVPGRGSSMTPGPTGTARPSGSPSPSPVTSRTPSGPAAPTSHSPSASHSPSHSPSLTPSPSRSRGGADVAGPAAGRPYLPPTPDAPEWQLLRRPQTAPAAGYLAPTPTASPQNAAADPAGGVQRVLPLGAGLALTGLGLAFFALRLRRG